MGGKGSGGRGGSRIGAGRKKKRDSERVLQARQVIVLRRWRSKYGGVIPPDVVEMIIGLEASRDVVENRITDRDEASRIESQYRVAMELVLAEQRVDVLRKALSFHMKQHLHTKPK